MVRAASCFSVWTTTSGIAGTLDALRRGVGFDNGIRRGRRPGCLNKQGGRVRSLFGLLLLPFNETTAEVLAVIEIEAEEMPGAAKIKILVVILLIGIASPFLG